MPPVRSPAGEMFRIRTTREAGIEHTPDPRVDASTQEEDVAISARMQDRPCQSGGRAALRVQDAARIAREGLSRKALERRVPRGGDVELVVLGTGAQVEHAKRGVTPHDALGEVRRGDMTAQVHGCRRQTERGRRHGERRVHATHGRERSMRRATANPASATTVTIATPAPRGTPIRSVNVTAPSAVLS